MTSFILLQLLILAIIINTSLFLLGFNVLEIKVYLYTAGLIVFSVVFVKLIADPLAEFFDL